MSRCAGDQLYNDNVWACTSLQSWFEVKDKAARLAIAPTEEQRAEVAEFYFFAYLRYLKNHPLGAANMASIAQVRCICPPVLYSSALLQVLP